MTNQIPEVAVGAAAKAIHEAAGWDWEDPNGWREICSTNEARAALEAAGPYMLAEVYHTENAAYRRGWCEGWRARYRACIKKGCP